jgi:hypothetical protein
VLVNTPSKVVVVLVTPLKVLVWTLVKAAEPLTAVHADPE